MSFEPATSGPTALTFNLSQGDPVDWLPPGAAENLRRLRQVVHDLHSLIPEFEQRHALATEKVGAEQRLVRLQEHPSRGGFGLGDNDTRVIDARRQLDKLADELQRLNDLDAERSQAWQTSSSVLSNVQTYLRDGRPGGTALQDYQGDGPRLTKGDNGLIGAIENRRRRVREVKADLHRVQSAPFPSSHAKQQMRAQIEALAQRGAPSVSALVEHDREMAWPTQQLMVAVHNAQPGAVGFAEVPDTLAVVAWLHRDALIARLDREIANEADDATALSHAEREKREAVVLADLLAVERDEAALVWQALAQSLPAFHRSDCSPLAILQCELIAAPHTNGRGR